MSRRFDSESGVVRLCLIVLWFLRAVGCLSDKYALCGRAIKIDFTLSSIMAKFDDIVFMYCVVFTFV